MEKKIPKCKHECEYGVVGLDDVEVMCSYQQLDPDVKKIIDEKFLKDGKDCTCEIIQ